MRRTLAWIGGLGTGLVLLLLALAWNRGSVCETANLYVWAFKKCANDQRVFCVVNPDYVIRYNLATWDLARNKCEVWSPPVMEEEEPESSEGTGA